MAPLGRRKSSRFRRATAAVLRCGLPMPVLLGGKRRPRGPVDGRPDRGDGGGARPVLGRRRSRQPLRSVVEVGRRPCLLRGHAGLHPAARRRSAPSWSRSITRNAARGLPSHLATIVLLDPETGALQAIMDGRYITEARTAAVSAASAKHLARPDARVLAVHRLRRAGAQPHRRADARAARSTKCACGDATPARRARCSTNCGRTDGPARSRRRPRRTRRPTAPTSSRS